MAAAALSVAMVKLTPGQAGSQKAKPSELS